MQLQRLLARQSPPIPWLEGDNIPWHDPAFSARMLQEHRSQEHDAASRRQTIIAEQVAWMHTTVCSGESTTVLDLGCGPGFYTEQLAALGYHCRGIDYSPASIAYAQETAQQSGSGCTYTLADIRQADFGTEVGLILLLYGEINVFRRQDAQQILANCYTALRAGGILILEPHTFPAVEQIGQQPATWYTRESGLFSSTPYLLLQEHFWQLPETVATIRYFVVDLATETLTRYAQSLQAYTTADYQALLQECGFTDLQSFPALTQHQPANDSAFFALVARKPAR